MALRFLNRTRELERLTRTLDGPPGLSVIYGRRRLGKSRLLREALGGRNHVFYVGDARDGPLQRDALAREIARVSDGFADVRYPDWDALFSRLYGAAPRGLVVAIDELPELVRQSPELPSVLQKHLDLGVGPHLVVAGSSQRMMQGLVLDAAAPLYGRATQILKIEPLGAAWLGDALGVRSPSALVEQHAAWGGVPRYWELAGGYDAPFEALEELVLDPLGVLHREPERLLLDDMSDVSRAASLLALVGQGCHRVSEMAGRLGTPATSLARPLAGLLELGLLARDVPFGRSTRDTKRTSYRIADPFLRTWYRFVEPNRSRLAAGLTRLVAAEVERAWPQHVGPHWEQLARDAVPRLELFGGRWNPASRWWGRGDDGATLELDVVAEATDEDRVLVAEAKRTASAREVSSRLAELARKAAATPQLAGRPVEVALFLLRKKGRVDDPRVVDASAVVSALR